MCLGTVSLLLHIIELYPIYLLTTSSFIPHHPTVWYRVQKHLRIKLQQISYFEMSRCDPVTADQVPPMKDLTVENITENVNILNSLCPNPRTRYIFERLVTHLHDFAREVRLSTQEWKTGIDFLTAAGNL